MAMQGGASSVVKYIYADVLWLVNLGVNYLLLLATGKLTGRHIRPWRLLAASAAGSVYAVSALFLPLSSAFSFPARLAFGVFMVGVCFPSQMNLSFVTVTAAFFLCSAITAGTAYSLLYTGASKALSASLLGGYDPSVHWWVVLLSLVVLSAFPVLARIGGYRPGQPLPLLTIEVTVQGRKIGLVALVDTGNNLRDPVSGLPVVVVDWDALRNVIPKEATSFFLSTWDRIPADLSDTSVGRRLRLIPFESLSGQKGVLPGFRPDKVILTHKDGKKTARNAIVGVSGERLSPNGLYQALVHPDLV